MTLVDHHGRFGSRATIGPVSLVGGGAIAGPLNRRGGGFLAAASSVNYPTFCWSIGFLGQISALWAKEVQRVKADCVVIDTAPNDRSLGAACAISDLVLVPCTPSGLDLEATVRTLEIVDALRVRPDGVPRLILVPKSRRPAHA